MDAESINRSITRLAHEILEHNNGPDNIILIYLLKISNVLRLNNDAGRTREVKSEQLQLSLPALVF